MAKSEKEDIQHSKKIQDDLEQALKSAEKQPDGTLFAGVYTDNWLGKVTITLKSGKLYFQSARSPQLRGEMSYYKGNTFVVRWANRRMKADAFVMFSLDQEGKPSGFSMKAISPLTDFSYDFHDLDFHRLLK